MRKNQSITAIAVVGSIVVLFTIIAFFLLGIERTSLNWLALMFLLLSEGVLFGGLIALRFAGAKHSRVFLTTGITTTLSLYFAVTLVSVLLAGFFGENLNGFILMELGIIALFAVIIVCVLAASRRISERKQADLEKVGSQEYKRGGF